MSNLLKKDTNFTIIEIGNVETGAIKKEIDLFDSEWTQNTSRQDNNIVHVNTKMYPLRFFSYDWVRGQDTSTQEVNSFKTNLAIDELQKIYSFLENYYSGSVVRAEIVKMMPGTKIMRHVDGGEMLTITRRCHIPITTSDEVYFGVFGNSINMKVGTVYEINNLLPHEVENNSDIERDHLILDILPFEMI